MPPLKTLRFLISLLAITILTIAGCSDPNSSFVFENGHPAGWVPSGHRAPAEADVNSCADCHGSDFSGGIAGVACTDCHLGDENNVHPLTWVSTENDHGLFVVSDPNALASCGISVCHGLDFAGGGVGVSCDDCHNTYPHVAGYADPAGHGADARSNILDCKFCHADPGNPPVYNGSNTGEDCLICHGTTATGAPHPALWIAGGNFTHFFSAIIDPPIDDRAGCEECHAPISDDPGCNIAPQCHAGGANLP